MNLSTPILICDASEEFRSLLREMLTKYGFFHVIEASSSEEGIQLISQNEKSMITLVHYNLLTNDLLNKLSLSKSFIVISPTDSSKLASLIAKFSVNNFISFPFSSKKLIEKISDILRTVNY